MKLVRIFVVYLSSLSVLLIESKESSAATAIAEIVKSFPQSMNFDFIVYKSSLDDLANKIAKSVKRTTNVTKINDLKSPEALIPIYQSAILFFSEEFLFREFYEIARLGNVFPKDFYFLVFIPNFKKNNFELLMDEKKPQKLFLFLYFLCDSDDGNHFELVTFTMFNQPNCRKEQRVEINRFSKVFRKWESRKFSMEKFRNLNGCELIVRRPKLAKFLEVYEFFESTLNITTKWDILGIPNDFTTFDLELYPIPTRLLGSRTDLDTKTFPLHCITFSDQTLIVSRFAPYSMAEKALLPLDDDVWYWLIGFVGFGVGVIVVLSLMRRPIRHFMIGSNVRAPLLNLL
jgi:hypothetical protein